MRHKGFGNMQCPIARALERVGEWWSILILRDAFQGLTRFDQFQRDLEIAPNMLTRRLNALVGAGLLERRLYSERPRRHEYLLTQRGRDFRPVLWTLIVWGNEHFSPEGKSVVLVDTKTGVEAEPVLVDRRSGHPIAAPNYKSVPGPAADERTRWLYARIKQDRSDRPRPPAAAKKRAASGAKAGTRASTIRHNSGGG